ncbi:hypothetical protein [Psychrobacillus sp. OK032]|uniref:hypothetical protein n=1 Tax=Psychrobacillus sp. OK032 TaxID=1884358 RepID=UPI0008B31CBF|nr:hypothetical protein [Psychrobacillus sp. OK032]SES44216.1 hypothetical protein SAMN05518872_11355 [Psychrobacillus sp. OK032]
MEKIVFVVLLLIISIGAVEKISVGSIESAEGTFKVDEQQELSIKQAIELAYPAALEWDENAQLLDAINIDLDDKAEKSIGSNGKRKYWNINFGVPDTHKNFLVTIYKGEIEEKKDLTVDGNSPYPKKDFIVLEDIKYDSPELLKKALKMGNVYPGRDWAKGYNFMLIKNRETNINYHDLSGRLE